MIHSTTQEPLQVSNAGTPAPYILVPFSQLEDLKALLDKHEIKYRASDLAISLNHEPEVVFVDLDRNADTHAIQNILDDAR